MDALELLKADHQRVSDLFDQLKTETAKQQRMMIFANIRDDLEAHMHIEETVFYPVFGKFDEFKSIIERSYEEHAKVKSLLNELWRQMPKSGPTELNGRIGELQQFVRQHVEEEEGELFPRVRKMMRRPEREQLGRHLEAAKNEFTEVRAA